MACANCPLDKDLLVATVINQVKQDLHQGDTTVLDELLRLVPRPNLIESLPEEQWY